MTAPASEAPVTGPPPKRGFAAMAGAYCLGTFNDNFFKQAVFLIAVYAGRAELQDVAATVFALPWLLFAEPAGWLADRFAKRRIVIAAKALELLAMGIGAAGILTGSWGLIMAMLFLMALQSTIFSPALNGSIPELFGEQRVVKANSVIKMLTISGVLVGIVLAGVALDVPGRAWGLPVGRVVVAAGVVLTALAGVALSFGVSSAAAADPSAKLPWSGPVRTLRRLWGLRRDRLLATIIVADAFVWFIAVLQTLLINQVGEAIGLSQRGTSLLLIPELGGFALGGLLAGRIIHGDWFGKLPAALLGLGVFSFAASFTRTVPAGWQVPWFAVSLAGAGVCGGVLLVPMESFFQVRPAPRQRGAVIASANFAAFAAMALAGPFDILLIRLSAPAPRFLAVAQLSVIAAAALKIALSRYGPTRQPEPREEHP